MQGESEDPAKPVGQRERHPGPPDVRILILVKTVDSPETLPETQPELRKLGGSWDSCMAGGGVTWVLARQPLVPGSIEDTTLGLVISVYYWSKLDYSSE